MSREIRRLPSARLDMIEIFQHLAADGSIEVARRFLANARESFRQLSTFPGLGTRYLPEDGRYSDLRYFPVSKFRSYIIFYRPIDQGIEVYRLLHGSRDISAALSEPDRRNPGEGREGQGA